MSIDRSFVCFGSLRRPHFTWEGFSNWIGLDWIGWRVLVLVCILFVYCSHALQTMWLRLELIAKIFSQVCLFVFFLWFFGVPNIKRYQNDEVLVVASTKHMGGILAPTISVVARNPVSRKGWKSYNITPSVEIIEDRCGNASDIQKCIVEETYNLADLVRQAHIGFKKNESLMNSSLWVEDFASPFYGRYFTLNLERRITPDYENDQIFLHLQKQTNFTIFIYHSKFFLLNSNLLSFPMIIKQVSSSMGSHYWNLAVTERFELNHPSDPCYEGKFDYRYI